MAVTKLVLVRHGESQWNKENRFTGWYDVDLSEKGVSEAKAAGKLLKEEGYSFDFAYTSCAETRYSYPVECVGRTGSGMAAR